MSPRVFHHTNETGGARSGTPARKRSLMSRPNRVAFFTTSFMGAGSTPGMRRMQSWIRHRSGRLLKKRLKRVPA